MDIYMNEELNGYANGPSTDIKESEFRVGDTIVQIGHLAPCKVLSIGLGCYFVRWRNGGDSMLWIDDVDIGFVKVD